MDHIFPTREDIRYHPLLSIIPYLIFISLGKRERVQAQAFSVSSANHPQSYLRLSDATLQYLNEQTHRKMQVQAATIYAQENEFKKQYADLNIIDLEELIPEFDEGIGL